MGMPLPAPILNAPKLDPDYQGLFDAWEDLSTCRVSGGPIPWLAMKQYADENRYDGDEREGFFHCVTQLDNAYLEHEAPKD